MLPRYHAAITARALGAHFDAPALRQIVRANVGQDSVASLLGVHPEIHVDNDLIAPALASMEAEHARIAALVAQPNGGTAQRHALGRLCHTVQDFYSHSNYVDLWLAQHGGTATPGEIDALDPRILGSPALHSGYFSPLRYILYRVPLLGPRIPVPTTSHDAMNLDAPERGPRFHLAVAAATRRTAFEYERAVAAVRTAGGAAAVERFHGRA